MLSKKHELGRSMVEMLGALAVMGVITVAFIKAYPYALDKHRANEIADAVNSRAMIATMEKAQYGEISLTGFPDTINGRPVRANTNFEDNKTQFEIIVSEVSEAVCENLMNSKPVNAIYVYGGLSGREATCSEVNQMAFVFEDT